MLLSEGSLSIFLCLLLLCPQLRSTEPTTIDCFTQNGPPYNGTLNRTAAGEPCLPWSEFTHLHLRSSWNATVLKEQSNYCRNPDDDPRGPWCMVTRAKYGTCGVPHCGRPSNYLPLFKLISLNCILLHFVKKIDAN